MTVGDQVACSLRPDILQCVDSGFTLSTLGSDSVSRFCRTFTRFSTCTIPCSCIDRKLRASSSRLISTKLFGDFALIGCDIVVQSIDELCKHSST